MKKSETARALARTCYELAKRYTDAGDDKTARQYKADGDLHLKHAQDYEKAEKVWFYEEQTEES